MVCKQRFITNDFLTTLDSGINVGVRLLIFGIFSSGYVLIKGGTFINLFIFFPFLYFFSSKFLPKINKRTPTFIPESRVMSLRNIKTVP